MAGHGQNDKYIIKDCDDMEKQQGLSNTQRKHQMMKDTI